MKIALDEMIILNLFKPYRRKKRESKELIKSIKDKGIETGVNLKNAKDKISIKEISMAVYVMVRFFLRGPILTLHLN